MSTRDMTNAPEHLYNFYVTWDVDPFQTQASVFYTIKGDTLVAGATVANSNFVPSIYEKEYGTLNATLTRQIGRHFALQLRAKNLTNPKIQEVYRSDFVSGEAIRSSYTKGREYSLSLSVHL
jgi:outer membrane receptor protein involved in Fe transport